MVPSWPMGSMPWVALGGQVVSTPRLNGTAGMVVFAWPNVLGGASAWLG